MALPRRLTKIMVQDKVGASRQYVAGIIKRYERGNFIATTAKQRDIVRRYQALKMQQKKQQRQSDRL